MLTAKRPAGITLELNVWNPLFTGEKPCKQGIHSGFATQADITRSPKHYQWPNKSDLRPLEIEKNSASY